MTEIIKEAPAYQQTPDIMLRNLHGKLDFP